MRESMFSALFKLQGDHDTADETERRRDGRISCTRLSLANDSAGPDFSLLERPLSGPEPRRLFLTDHNNLVGSPTGAGSNEEAITNSNVSLPPLAASQVSQHETGRRVASPWLLRLIPR